jgi:dipeptidyl aminopeptidase/acylaminoacyl peptidase
VTRSLKRKLAFGALGVVVLSVVLSALYQRLFARDRRRFPYLGRPISEQAYAALAAKPGWASTHLDVGGGIRLNGLIRRPVGTDTPWVLFYPGNDESQLDRGQTYLARLGEKANWGLAVFAYRGYDSSDGRSELRSLQADAPEILERFCAAEGVPPARVHVAGFSIGGYFAVAAVGQAARRGKSPASLTLLASVDDIVMYHRSRFELLRPGEDYFTQPLLALVPAPVLVLQGTADHAFNGAEPGRNIARTLGKRATYVELEGVDHVPLLANERALERVRDFVREHSR